jgi:hypothetical protein
MKVLFELDEKNLEYEIGCLRSRLACTDPRIVLN